ncbi:MAG: AmmeMemoRadiSam system radical SAM enzyme [Bacteroidales bacterium]
MIEASFYSKQQNDEVKCNLCPHQCIIKPGRTGICLVRKNFEGKLYSINYGVISSAALDPIEKKPLFNFYPGSKIFSIGSIGCNLKCSFCQNWQIATASELAVSRSEKDVAPQAILETALGLVSEGNIGVAYTYNEPTVWYEYMRDIALLVKENNLKNVMVSNGFIEQEPLGELLELIDAFNIDLKGYNNEFYQKNTKSELNPVLETLKAISRHGNHLEIAYLVIPGENDDPDRFLKMMKWLKENLGEKFVIHINRYFPCYKMSLPATPVETLYRLRDIALSMTPHVHLGNI